MIDIEILRQIIEYDPGTGILRWKEKPAHLATSLRSLRSWNSRLAGRTALTAKDSGGYLHGTIFGKNVLAHRVAWALHYGQWPQGHIDHINGDIADNRIENLRIVTVRQNARNRKLSVRNRSGKTGVRQQDGLWLASISDDSGNERHLGSFPSFDAASAARSAAEADLGYHQNHGRTCGGGASK